MEEFVYLIKPIRDNLIDSMTQRESEIMENHFQYLKELLFEKKLVMAGPCLDGAFGIVVFKAETMADARIVMENDPSVKEGLMNGELHRYRVSLIQE